MKHIWILALTLIANTLLFGQAAKSIQGSSKTKEPAKASKKLEIKGVSPATAIFMLKLRDEAFTQKIAESEALRKHAGIKQINGTFYVNAFIIASDQTDFDKYGVISENTSAKVKTGLIPIDQLFSFAADEKVQYIQMGNKAELKLDAALAATWVTEAHQGVGGLSQAYSGEGVVVGIIDGGFDYTHPTFYDSTYTNYRIKRIWDQTASSGTPPPGFAYGRELVNESDILAAQTDLIPNQSHGSHVAGIAAGSGARTSGLYKGVAYKSDLVFVTAILKDVEIADGITYIFNYAESVGKPCVINISIGSHIGPHDGKSLFDQLCDEAVGDGKILVGSAGNDALFPLYLEKTFTPTDTLMYSFIQFPLSSLGSNGETPIDIWGNPNTSFSVSISIYNTENNSFEDGTPYISTDSTAAYKFILYDDDPLLPDSCVIAISTEIYPQNGKPRVYVELDHSSQDDSFRYVLIGIVAADTQIKMWADYRAGFTDLDYPLPAISGSNTSSINETGGTGNNIISVGAFTTKNSLTNLSNQTVEIPYPTAIGEIAPFSSHGSTADNRTKPDITAPGNVVVSAVNSFDPTFNSSNPSTVFSVTEGSNTWYYAAFQGTSMAAPMVTGVVALLLEAYPELDVHQALELLRDQAYRDEFTGEIPAEGDNTWGWGKIDAEATLLELESLIPAMPAIAPDGNIAICAGETQTLTAPAGFVMYEWSTEEITQSISVMEAGEYAVRVANEDGFYSPWSAPVSVTVNAKPATPSVTNNSDTLTSTAAVAYQWYFNNSLIEGATEQVHIAKNSGLYHVVVANENNCTAASTPINVTVSSIESMAAANQFMTINPNPNNGSFVINSLLNQPIPAEIIDAAGRIVNSFATINPGKTTIEAGNLRKGIYFIRFKVAGEVFIQKLVIN
ncbi:MAG: S8 family serine peptidase [Bacteroidales bacterium]|jgi:subtilisin family serine protease|nr:S8 family serine peptidase [Bacteroidales bacterium]